MAEQKLVGQNYVTPDLRAKVTGRARYAEDFRTPGMLHARPWRPSRACGRTPGGPAAAYGAVVATGSLPAP